jgi:hypothetical protein
MHPFLEIPVMQGTQPPSTQNTQNPQPADTPSQRIPPLKTDSSKPGPAPELALLTLVVLLGSLILGSVTISYAIRLSTRDTGVMTHSMRSWVGP